MAADAWELRTARLEAAYEQIDRRLGAVEGRLSTLEHKMDTGLAELRAEIRAGNAELRSELYSEIRGLRSEMHRYFFWLLGVAIASGVAQVGLKSSGH